MHDICIKYINHARAYVYQIISVNYQSFETKILYSCIYLAGTNKIIENSTTLKQQVVQNSPERLHWFSDV